MSGNRGVFYSMLGFELLLRILFSLTVVGLSSAELTAALMNISACPKLSYQLIPASLSLLAGCLPFAILHLYEALILPISLKRRCLMADRWRKQAAEDALMEPVLTYQVPSVRSRTMRSVGPSVDNFNVLDVDAEGYSTVIFDAAVIELDDFNQQQQYEQPLLTDIDDEEVEMNSELSIDLQNWLRQQYSARELALIKSCSEPLPSTSAIRCLVESIRDFYKPNATMEERDRRLLVALLICLPVSCAYALPLFELLYTGTNSMPDACRDSHSSIFIAKLSHFSLWVRISAMLAFLLASVVASGFSLVRRRIQKNRLAERLRP